MLAGKKKYHKSVSDYFKNAVETEKLS